MFTSCADSLARYANRLKKSRNVTNQIISDTSMVPVGTVGRFMAGSAKNTSIDTIIKILTALDADLNVVVRIMAAGSSGISDEDLDALLHEVSQQQPAPARDPSPDTAADVAADTASSLAETFNDLARRKDEMHRATVEHLEQAHHADTDRLERAYEKERQRQHAVIIALIVALAIMIAGIIIVAIFDVITPNAGWINNETLAAVVKGAVP